MLSGIRVVDFTRYFPGPFATLRLADRGAEVIKVEEPRGDPARFIDTFDGKEGAVFRSQNRNKYSVVANLKERNEYEKVLRLIENADVVIESFRPGVAKKLGIDFDTLLEVNPLLVYCSLTGYGQNTSLSKLGSHDLNYMAMSGVLAQLTDDIGKPIKPNIALADIIGGITASEAILYGLLQREMTGKAVYLDVSILDSMISIMGLHVTHESATKEEHGINPYSIAYNIYTTKDKRYVTLAALEVKFWINFCKGVDREDLIPFHQTPADFDNPYYREMEEIFRSRTLEEWVDFSLKVDCCMAPVLKPSEVKSHTYVRERGLIESRGGLNYVTTCYRECDSFVNSDIPYPRLGEHNKWFL